MKNNLLCCLICFLLVSCCDCDSFNPPRIKLESFKINQLYINGVAARESPVAFEIIMTDSSSARNYSFNPISSSFLNLRMEQCDCFQQVLVENPVIKIAIFELIDNQPSGSDISDRFVANLVRRSGESRFTVYRKIREVLADLVSFNMSEGAAYIGLFDTADVRKPNASFLIELELQDGTRVELRSPTYFTTEQ